jgi:hypothetical protein
MLLERLKKISESPEMDLFGELPEQVDSDEEDEGEGK